ERGRQSQPCGRRGGHEAGECRHAKVVEGIEGAPEGVIMAMAGLNAWGHEARHRLMLEKRGPEVQLGVEKAETVAPHGLDRRAGGHNPHCWGLRRRLVDALGDPACVKHACDTAKVI